MPIARINGRLLHFVHVPKCAGSSVEAYMASKGQVLLQHGRRLDWARTTPQHMDAEVTAAWLPRAAFDGRFVVLRDPEARLMSAFCFRAEARPPAGVGLQALIGRARVASRPWRRAVRVDRGVRWLDADEWALAAMRACRRDPYVLDNHIRPQADFWDAGLTPFLLEDGLGPVLDWIDRVTGTARAGRVPHEKRGGAERLRFAEATRAAIREFYARDYALLARLRAE